MARKDLEVVAITGASAGVGRAVTQRFAKDGASLALMARDAERLEAAAAEARALGARNVIALPLDVADAAAVDEAADRIEGELGPMDLWVNNAMVTVLAKSHEITPEEFARVTDVTYLGTVHGTLAALKHMRQRGAGHILQVGSALAYRAVPLQTPYCAAKSAALAFTNGLRSELIHDEVGVDLSVVHLPAVNTPQFTWARNKTDAKAMPVPPIFAPELAADAIHHVAHNPVREYWLARSAYQAILGQKLLPAVADHAAQTALEAQKQEKPSEPRPDNLFEPVPGPDVGAEGPFTEEAQHIAPMHFVDKNRGALVGTALLGATVFAALTAARRRSA